jgi:translation initiation factor IF-3
LINEEITHEEVRVIGSNGDQLGIMSAKQAQKVASEENLDLVEIAPKAKPPVVRVMDYGKYKYEQAKKAKEAKKKQHQVELKEIRMRPKTDTNDLNVKLSKAREFIEEKNKVKITIQFRGRELAYKNFGFDLMKKVEKQMEDVAKVEFRAKMEGRNMFMILAPN